MLPTHRRAILLGATLSLTFALAACGGGEGRQKEYLERAQQHLDSGNYDKARIDAKNVLQINPNNADAYFLMAELAEKEQNWQQVLGNLNKAIELAPNNLKANTKLGQVYLFANNLEKAREQADTVFALAPGDAGVLGLLSAVEFREGDKEKAEKTALSALQGDPGNTLSLTILSELYQGDKDGEVLALIEAGGAAYPDNVTIRLLKIRVLERMDRPQDVIAEYEQLIDLEPESDIYLGKLVDFYIAEERPEDAERLLRERVKALPERNQVKLMLARFLLMKKGGDAAVAELEAMLQQDPQNMELRSVLGGQLAAMGQLERAVEVYTETFEFDTTGSNSQTARNQLTQLAISGQDMETARRWNNEALELEAENPEALANRARLKMMDGEIADAIPDLRMALRAKPDSVPILLLLAQAQQKNRSVDLALDNYRAVLRLQPRNLIALYQSAVILSGQQNYQEAEANIEAILAQQPANVLAINLLTEIYSRQARWDDAQLLVDRLAANEQTAALSDVMTASLELRQGNYDKAIELAKGALAENTRISTAATIVAQAYAAKGDTEGAITFVEGYLAENDGSGEMYDILAQLYVNSEQADKAVALYRDSIKRSPERIQSYINLARVMQFRGTTGEIVDVYKGGIAANPGNVLLKLELANRYQLSGEYQKALDYLEEAYALDATSLPVKNNLAGLLIDHFPSEENMLRAQQLTRGFEQSGSPALIDTLGWLQYKQGNIPQAINLLVAAQKAGGNGSDYWYHLGMAYLKNDQVDLAREQFEKVIAEGNPDFSRKTEVEETLKGL